MFLLQRQFQFNQNIQQIKEINFFLQFCFDHLNDAKPAFTVQNMHCKNYKIPEI